MMDKELPLRLSRIARLAGIKVQDAWKDGESSRQSPYGRAMSPMLTSLRLSGLGVVMKWEEQTVAAWKRAACKLWSVFLIVYLFLMIVRVIAAIVTGSTGQVGRSWVIDIVLLMYTIFIFTYIVVGAVHSWRASCLSTFYEQIANHESEYPRDACDQETERRFVYKILAATWSIAVGMIIVFLAYSYGPAEAEKSFFAPYLYPFEQSILGVIINVPAFVIFAAANLVVGTIFIMCELLRRRFADLNKEVLAACVTNNLPASVGVFRRRFVSLAACVQALDKTLCIYTAAVLVYFVPFICFLVYQLLQSSKESNETATEILLMNWIATSTAFALLVMGCEARLYHTAHLVTDHLEMSAGTSLQWTMSSRADLDLWLNLLNSGKTGITVAGVYVVTKDTIVTLASVLISYLVLVWQMSL